MSAVAVVRIRGHYKVRDTIERTMRSLRLTRANHCVVVPEKPEVLGMVHKVKDYVTYGPVTTEQIEELLRKRGRLEGGKALTDAHVKSATAYGSIKSLAEALSKGEVGLGDLPGVKPLFRLNPPKMGFKGGTKRSWRAHGALGDRGPAIGELLARMI